MREKILFNDDWLFHLGDIENKYPRDKGPIYATSKTERMHWGPASRFYNDTVDNFNNFEEMCTDGWENVTLPHDYVIMGIPDKNENCAHGFLKYDNAWYRKRFTIPKEDTNKRLTLLFDGIAIHSTIYLNGCLMAHNFSGYNTFEVDITDMVKYGEENVLAIYVEAKDLNEGWWYEGAGIYRHVWLCKTDTVSVDLWGVYVAPKDMGNGVWDVSCETTLRNDRYEDVEAEVVTCFVDADGKTVGQGGALLSLAHRELSAAKYHISIENPKLWDLENPNLYSVVTKVIVNNEEVDQYTTRTGFRTFVLDADKGLFLNGKHIKIKGVCAHQDFGLTGRAVADNVHRYKMELLKEMGANGYRTSHYMQTEAILDALDELGFVVMDETRWFESTKEGKEQLTALIKRDRNRPSVLFWSVGNEELHHTTEEGRRICKSLMDVVRKLDDTRPVMTAVSNDPDIATVYDELDAIGINYNLHKYDKIKEKYPNKPIFSSECCATGSTRGWYFDDNPQKAFMGAYDKDTTKWFLGREKTWKFICKREWVLGEYQWIGFEHRGETVWPRLCSQSGAIDLYLQKKDAFYQNQSHWIEDRPIVHVLPHWNHRGLEGESIKVFAYTNCDELELLLNGKSCGKQKIEKYGHGEWLVKYEPGKIVVNGYNNGVLVCSDSKETTGAAVKLEMKLENRAIKANGSDIAIISCYCVDENGKEVPDAEAFVQFNTNALGAVIATGSDITDHIPPHITERKMRAGRITVAVRVGQQAGDLKVYAHSDSLIDAVLTIGVE